MAQKRLDNAIWGCSLRAGRMSGGKAEMFKTMFKKLEAIFCSIIWFFLAASYVLWLLWYFADAIVHFGR